MSKQSEITKLQEENAKVSVMCVSVFVLNDKNASDNAIYLFFLVVR